MIHPEDTWRSLQADGILLAYSLADCLRYGMRIIVRCTLEKRDSALLSSIQCVHES